MPSFFRNVPISGSHISSPRQALVHTLSTILIVNLLLCTWLGKWATNSGKYTWSGNVCNNVLIIITASKEAAFANAIASAGVVLSIARGCRDGQLDSCGCSSAGRPADLKAEWIWGGCGDNIHYGYKLVISYLVSFLSGRLVRFCSRSPWYLCKIYGFLLLMMSWLSGRAVIGLQWRDTPTSGLRATSGSLWLTHNQKTLTSWQFWSASAEGWHFLSKFKLNHKALVCANYI